MDDSHTIAVLSDTHGAVPWFVTDELKQRNVDHIIHAGDIGDDMVINTLQRISPTTWVRGNMDSQRMGDASAVAEIDGLNMYVLHNLYDLDLDPAAASMCAVIHGHLHVPSIEWKGNVLFLNPGSCAHPRQGHPPSFAIIKIVKNKLIPQIVFKK